MHDNVAVCGVVPKMMLVGLIGWHDNPEVAPTVRSTVPVNPLIAFSVTVTEAATLTLTGAGDCDVMLKSLPKMNLAVAVWVSVPVVPVTVA